MSIQRRAIISAFWLLLLITASDAQDALALSVQADILRDKIYAQAKANDADGVLAALGEYHKLVDANKLTFPVPLYWIEAKAAHDSGDAKHALAALTAFLNKTDHESPDYKQGVALYPAYEQAAKNSESLERDSRRAALIASIPKLIQSLRDSLVEIPEGQFRCPSEKFKCSVPEKRPAVKVGKFRITKCIPPVVWVAFSVDTGRGDAYNRSTQCVDADFWTSSFPSESDVEAFVAWVSAHDGGKWRLPSEAELGLVKERAATEPVASKFERMGVVNGRLMYPNPYHDMEHDLFYVGAFLQEYPVSDCADTTAFLYISAKCTSKKTFLVWYFAYWGQRPPYHLKN